MKKALNFILLIGLFLNFIIFNKIFMMKNNIDTVKIVFFSKEVPVIIEKLSSEANIIIEDDMSTLEMYLPKLKEYLDVPINEKIKVEFLALLKNKNIKYIIFAIGPDEIIFSSQMVIDYIFNSKIQKKAATSEKEIQIQSIENAIVSLLELYKIIEEEYGSDKEFIKNQFMVLYLVIQEVNSLIKDNPFYNIEDNPVDFIKGILNNNFYYFKIARDDKLLRNQRNYEITGRVEKNLEKIREIMKTGKVNIRYIILKKGSKKVFGMSDLYKGFIKESIFTNDALYIKLNFDKKENAILNALKKENENILEYQYFNERIFIAINKMIGYCILTEFIKSVISKLNEIKENMKNGSNEYQFFGYK